MLIQNQNRTYGQKSLVNVLWAVEGRHLKTSIFMKFSHSKSMNSTYLLH